MASNAPTTSQWSPQDSAAYPVADAKRLATLREIGQLLADQPDLRMALKGVLQLLTGSGEPDSGGGAILVFREHSHETDIQVIEGPSGMRPRGLAADSDGLIAKVVETLQAMVVPPTPRTVMASTKAGATRGLTKVVAPILLGRHVVGVMVVTRPFDPKQDDARLLDDVSLVCTMTAQAVAAHRRAEQDRQRLLDETTDLRGRLEERPPLVDVVGTSGPLGQVRSLVAQVAPSNTTVLLRGESGTGKGLIAQAIHLNSPRAKKPFITVSCAALPPDLIESELFGYEKGAFTGAHTSKKGRFEMANGGTLFLDEVGELTLPVQLKLLRVLQEREFDRLGGTESLSLDVRLVAATNRNLDKAIASGAFREDLFYRLNVFPIFVPPLRERGADILLLADHFLEKFAREHGKHVARISTPAIDMLMSYHWPGNVRELSNAIERAVVVCDGGVIHSHHLPPSLQTAEASGTTSNLSLQEMVEAVEKDALMDALKTTRGDRATAARLLRTTRRIFNYKVKRYRIDWQRFRG
jgi:Nif-specific regulatory protein